jgi:23S rRNA pseudouridine1911/1915/1917 synthase
MATYNGREASEKGAANEKDCPSKTGLVEGGPLVCFEGSGVVGVIKPAGLPTQAPAGIESMERWLRGKRGPADYLGVPHRLDRAVSGVMLFAATPRAARQLSRQFERRQIVKTYLALTELPADPVAVADLEAGEWQEWIDSVAKIPDQPRARIAADDEPGSRQAETRVRVLGSFFGPDGVGMALLELQPRTGRMHQLRVQAAARGLPILGDVVYGSRRDDPAAAGIALHAWRIAFTDPDTKEPRELEAPPPEAWPAACHEFLAPR